MSDGDLPDGGWIKLWRSALEHPCLTELDTLGVWTKLLLQAAKQPCKVRFRKIIVPLDTGQLAISVREMAAKGNLGHKKLRSILAQLRTHRMLRMDTPPGTPFTLITILNYQRFQTDEKPNGHSPGHTDDENWTQPQTHRTRKEVREESLTTVVESVPPAPAREEAPVGADDGEVLTSAVEAFCRDKRIETRGLSAHAARRYIDVVRPSYRAPGALASAIRQSLLPDQQNPVAVLLSKAGKFGVAVQVAIEEAAKPRREPIIDGTRNSLATIRNLPTDNADADQSRADPFLAYALKGRA
jgi:hypothetical protein